MHDRKVGSEWLKRLGRSVLRLESWLKPQFKSRFKPQLIARFKTKLKPRCKPLAQSRSHPRGHQWRGVRWGQWQRRSSIALLSLCLYLLLNVPTLGINFLSLLGGSLTPIAIAQSIPVTATAASTSEISPEERARLLTELSSLWTRAYTQYNGDEILEGLRAFERILEIYRRLGERSLVAYTAATNMTLYMSIGDYDQVLNLLQEALPIAKDLGDLSLEATLYDTQGLTHYQIAEYDAALSAYRQAQALLTQIPTPSESPEQDKALVIRQGYLHNRVGAVYHQQGQLDEAIVEFQSAYQVGQQVGDLALMLQSADYLGKFERDRGNLAAAEQHQLEAIRLIEQQNVVMATAERNYYDSLDRAQAEARRAGDGSNSQVLNTIRPKFVRPVWTALRLMELSRTYAQGDRTTAAREYADRAAGIIQTELDRDADNTDRLTARWTLSGLGSTYRLLGDYQQAERVLRQAIELHEQFREQLGNSDRYKVLFSDTDIYLDSFEQLQILLIEQGKPQEALEIAERGRARAFVELIAERLSSGRTPNVDPPSIGQIRNLAQQLNTTLVEYSLIRSDKLLYIWVVSPSGEVTFHAVDLANLDLSIEHLIFAARCPNQICERRVLASSRGTFAPNQATLNAYNSVVDSDGGVDAIAGSNSGLNSSANGNAHNATSSPSVLENPPTGLSNPQNPYLRQLYDLTIAPIVDRLPQDPNAHIAISPQGVLFLVPFPALQDTQGRYLIEQHTLLTTPSIQVLGRTHDLRQTVHTRDALVVGNPTMPANLTPLEGAEAEAKEVARWLETQPLIGDAATEAIVRQDLTNSRIVHLATHGTFDERDGSQSAIALAPSGEQDGWLTSREVLNLDLNAEMVVLSACSTGRGRITGDGVVGLSRSLVASGAASVVVSLWDVNDAATELLMSSFYETWSQAGVDKAQALRSAMLTTKAAFPSPYFWSAFLLIGEPD